MDFVGVRSLVFGCLRPSEVLTCAFLVCRAWSTTRAAWPTVKRRSLLKHAVPAAVQTLSLANMCRGKLDLPRAAPNLRIAKFRYCDILDSHLDGLPSCLRVLSLHDCILDKAYCFQELVSRLENLRSLDLRRTLVSIEALVHATRLPCLTSLGVPRTGGCDEFVLQLMSCRLRRLLFSEAQRLSDAGVAALASLHTLESLFLEGVTFAGEGLAKLAQLKHFRRLTLDDCSGSPPLSALRGITSLSLGRATKFAQEDLAHVWSLTGLDQSHVPRNL